MPSEETQFKKGHKSLYTGGSKNGHFVSEETKKKIGKANKGRKMSVENIEKMRLFHIGKKQSPETVAKRILKNKGQKRTIEFRKFMSELRKGNKSNLWKGGVTEVNKIIRDGIDFRLWREAIFKRDNFICQKCGEKGGELHPHHIKNFSQYPELRFAIDNGKTLCYDCHWAFHKKYGQQNNTEEQLKEFLQPQMQQQQMVGNQSAQNQMQPIQ